MSWKDRSACGPDTAHLFFPAENPSAAVYQLRAARQICESCPVKPECLEESLADSLGAALEGVWGGLTRPERNRLRGKMRKGRRAVA